MNKQQITLPLVCVVIAVIVLGTLRGCKNARAYTLSRSRAVGQSLIAETNSTFLVSIGPELKAKLNHFLASPTRVETVSLGDAKSPIGNGSASSQLWLINERQERLTIRLRHEIGSDKFNIAGFWTPSSESDVPKQ